MRRMVAFSVLPALWLLTGCADTGTVQALQQRVIDDADPDEVLVAATTILQREFGRCRVDASSRRITTTPIEFTTERESGTARDLYRGRSTMRRSAQLYVARTGGQTVARIRVDVERRDTERQTIMQPQGHRLSDNPGQETPIETDAATTAQQNTVWTYVRRDRTLERAILDELREQFARLAAPEEGAPTEPSPSDRVMPAAPEGEPVPE